MPRPVYPRAVPTRMLTQTEMYFDDLAGGLIERIFLSHQRPDPVPNFHTHAGEQVILALEGEGVLEVLRDGAPAGRESATLPVHEGDVAVLAADQPHRWITRRGELTVLAINFCGLKSDARRQPAQAQEVTALAESLVGAGAPEVHAGLVKGDAEVRRLAEEFQSEARLRRPGARLRVGALAVELLVRIARLRLTGGPSNGGGRLAPRHYVERAREYLHAAYRQPVSLKDLAERVGLSVTHLHRLFVARLRVAPMTYLRRYRLSRAADLLAGTARPVREIAREVGMPNAELFSKAFRREFGHTPRAHRQEAQQEGRGER